MADDEIEKLLREVAQVTGDPSARRSPERPTSSSPKRGRAKSGRRLFFAGVSGLVMGGAMWAAGLMIPLVPSWSFGLGAAVGGFTVALVAGPPSWLRS